MTVPSFNLIDHSWLPVQRHDGVLGELSLREVFVQAGELRRLVGDVPTQEFALLRLLLAVLHDAIDGPRSLDEWEELWDDGLPVKRITDYLEEHRHRFDLLHPREPFFQTPGLRTAKDEIRALDLIVADVPNGTRYFTTRSLGAATLTFAEASRWLVHAHAFDISGIKTGAVGDPRAKGGKGYPQGVGWAGNLGGILVEGNDLKETLLLNLIAFDTGNLRIDPERDLPAWRRPVTGPEQASAEELSLRPGGVRDLYTWQSRRVRLHADADAVYGVVLAYGDALSPHNMHQREPMTCWRRSPAQEKKLGLPQVYLPREHDPGRSAWRGLGAIVAGRAEGAEQRKEAAKIVRPRILDWVARLTVEGPLAPDFLIRARLFGMVYGTQQSLTDEIVDDSVSMPVVLLHEENSHLGQAAINAVHDAEAAVTALGGLASDLAVAEGTEEEPPRTAARELAFATLDGPFRKWLAELKPGDAAEERREFWQREAYRIVSSMGDELLREAGDAAWTGRVVPGREGRSYWLNAGRADLIFRGSLSRALPMASATPSRTEPTQEART